VNVELQVIGSALRAVAEEMGAVLIRSSFSANIKDRRDCSTAIFDDEGRMIAQAEHIPVHLGAMPDAVDAVRGLEPAPDEIYVLNDPYTGGTHLPDVTIVSRTPLGFAVSRAHHADVGGMEPASLPAFSRELLQEGLVLPPVQLTDEVWRLFLANTRSQDGASTSSARSADVSVSLRRWTSSTGIRSGWCARRSTGCRTGGGRPRTRSRLSKAT
jgi:N-methylhydantoinase B